MPSRAADTVFRHSGRALALAALVSTLSASAARAETPEICLDPVTYCSDRLPASCLEKYGAGSAPAADDAICAPAFDSYGECVAEASELCSEPAADATVDGDTEDRAERAYKAVESSDNPEMLELVAERYPGTFWADLARTKAAELRAAAAEPEPASEPAAEPASAPAPAAPPAPDPDDALHRAAQRALKQRCFYTGAIDGDWGPGSRAGMRAFQKRVGLTQSGAVTPASLEMLERSDVDACAPPAPAAPEPAPEPLAEPATPEPAAPEPARPAATEPTPPAATRPATITYSCRGSYTVGTQRDGDKQIWGAPRNRTHTFQDDSRRAIERGLNPTFTRLRRTDSAITGLFARNAAMQAMRQLRNGFRLDKRTGKYSGEMILRKEDVATNVIYRVAGTCSRR